MLVSYSECLVYTVSRVFQAKTTENGELTRAFIAAAYIASLFIFFSGRNNDSATQKQSTTKVYFKVPVS
jgi:hypothetical protein